MRTSSGSRSCSFGFSWTLQSTCEDIAISATFKLFARALVKVVHEAYPFRVDCVGEAVHDIAAPAARVTRDLLAYAEDVARRCF
jgi:hypothetical protein